jgi:hypothetical protein
MDSGIGATGADNRNPMIRHPGKCSFDLLLDARLRR